MQHESGSTQFRSTFSLQTVLHPKSSLCSSNAAAAFNKKLSNCCCSLYLQLSFQLQKLPSYFINSSRLSRGIAENYRFITEQRHFDLSRESVRVICTYKSPTRRSKNEKKIRASILQVERLFGVVAAESQEAPPPHYHWMYFYF